MSTDKCNHKRKIFVTNRHLYRRAEKEVNEIVSYLNSSSKNEMQREIVAETLTESFLVDCTDTYTDASISDISNIDFLNTSSDLIKEINKHDTVEAIQNSQESNNCTSIVNAVRMWALTNSNVPHSSISLLLTILHPFHPELPFDVRTLLKTSSLKFNVKVLKNGQFIYLGIENALKTHLFKNSNFSENIIKLIINVDGLYLFKSSSTNL